MSKRTWTVRASLAALTGALVIAWSPAADAQSTRCEIPRTARDIWRCERGFVIGPENVIIRLPIPETDPEALYNAGIEAAGREDWRVAIAYFTAAHQRDHLVPRYMYNLGLAHARAGNEVPAIAWLAAYLLAEPNAPNRAAIWAQVAELEAAVAARTELLWRRAEDGANTSFSGSANAGHFRSAAYESLYRSAADAGELVRAREYYRLYGSADGGAPSAEFLRDGYEALLNNAVGSAMEDHDVTSARTFMVELPANRHRELVLREYDRHLSRLSRELPLVTWPDSIGFLGEPYQIAIRTQWKADSIRSSAELWRMNSHTGFASGGPMQYLAFPFLRRSAEALTALQRIGTGDWNGEPFDDYFRNRELDDYGRVSPTPRSRAEGDLLRYFSGEAGAALFGEASLLVGDRASAAAAARIARQFAERGLSEARRINRDMSFESQTEYVRSEAIFGYGRTRLDALLAVENGDIDGGIEQLTVFLSRQNYALARFNGRIEINAPYAYTTPGLGWSEAQYLGTSAVVRYLLLQGRRDDALRVAEGLDSLRRRLMLEVSASGAAMSPQDHLEESIAVARTLGGAPDNLTAFIRVTQSAPMPTQQIALMGIAASDLTRGVRRARAAYERAGATWGAPTLPPSQATINMPAAIAPEQAEIAARAPSHSVREFDDCSGAGWCPTMVALPAGAFMMGSADNEAGRDSNEGPQRTVHLRSFAIGKFEVTFDQWAACVSRGGCGGNPNPGDEGWGRGSRPVINLSWHDATEYVRWLSSETGQPYRLLTEAEWEYAARAGATTPYWWGASMSGEYANYLMGSFRDQWPGSTAPVGSFPANPFGLHDIIGNAMEWVQDCWTADYRGAPIDGSAATSGFCNYRVSRGGGWRSLPSDSRLADRGEVVPRPTDIGLRVARTLN